MFQELTNDNDIKSILNYLTEQRNYYWQNSIYDNYWHTARTLQSITHLVIEKKLFVYDIQNVKALLLRLQLTGHWKVYFEIWINDKFPLNDEIIDGILVLAKEILNRNLTVSFLCLPTNIFQCLINKSSEYQLKIIFKNICYDYFYDVVNKPINHCPLEDFLLDEISVDNVKEIIQIWKHGKKEDKDWLEKSCLNYPSIKLLDKTTKEMIGQFIYLLQGTFGALVINEHYRGRGLAMMLTTGLLQKIKEQKMDMLIEIEETNYPSQKLFNKLNFKKTSESHYLVFENA